jgi:hypothetical protein
MTVPSAAAPLGAREMQFGGALLGAGLPDVALASSLAGAPVPLRLDESALLAFVDARIGARSARDTQPLPIEPFRGALVQLAKDAGAGGLESVHARSEARSEGAPTRAAVVEGGSPRSPEAGGASFAAGAAPFAVPAEGLPIRPGAIGARTEQLAGSIGVQAAALAMDYADPVSLAAFTHARAAVERSFVAPGTSAAGDEIPRSSAGARVRDRIAPASIAPPLHADVSSSAKRPEQVAAPTVAAARGFDAAMGERLDAAWTMLRLFPVAAQAALAAGPAAFAASLGAADGAVRAAAAGGVAPSMTSPVAAGRGDAVRGALATFAAPVDASPRLPRGRRPRGSFTWPASAEFAGRFNAWTPPPSVLGAVGVGEAASAGLPAWEGLPPVAPIDAEVATGAEGDEIGPAGARPSMPVVAARRGRDARTHAPALRLLSGGADEGEKRWASAPALTQVATGSVAPAPVASGEPAAKLVEALRAHQQHAPSDDRVTLADLTLVAVASASQQLAASTPERAASVAQTVSSAVSAIRSHLPGKSPELEQREIEELARQVLDEVYTLMKIARERSGDPWEA